MNGAPNKPWFAATRSEVLVNLLVNLIGGGVAYVGNLLITWGASQSSRQFSGLFPALWAFLTSPVSIPVGLLVAGVGFVAVNLLVFVPLKRARPSMSRVTAACLSGIVVAFVVAGASMAFYLLRDREPPRAREVKRLTAAGKVVAAAISPDGRFFAYAADDGDGRQSLHLGQVDETAAALTIAGPAEVSYAGLAFSPDGLRVYFVKYGCNATAGTLYQMATLGGQPTPVKDGLPRFFGYALSPDGNSIAYVRNAPENQESALVTLKLPRPGQEPPKEQAVAALTMPARFIGVPAWSPDGEVLTCALRKSEGEKARLVGYRAGQKDVEEFSDDLEWEFVAQVSSLSGSGRLILAAPRVYGPYHLSRLPYPGGRAEQLTHEVNNYDGLSLTADAGAVVTVEDALSSEVWVAPAGQPGRAVAVRNSGGKHNDHWGFSWTPAGRILYVVEEQDGQNIWEMEGNGSGGGRRLIRGGDNVDPCATGDGRYIVFTSKRSGSYQIWRVNADGGGEKQLTRRHNNFAPHCSRDGTVVYTSEINGQWTVWQMDIEGGAHKQLNVGPSQWPAVAPDGRVAFYTQEQGVMKLGVLPASGGSLKTYPVPCTASTWAELRWISDGRELTYVDTRGGVSNIYAQALPDDPAKPMPPPRRLTNFTEGRIFRYDWSADDRLVLSHGSVKRDAVLVNFRDRKKAAGG